MGDEAASSSSVMSGSAGIVPERTFATTALATPRDTAASAPAAPADTAARTQGDVKKPSLRLPHGYNVVAVRETLLSEAPFVTRGNKAFWRRMMDNDQFVTMFSAGFHHCLECVSDHGKVLTEKLCDLDNSEMMDLMGHNLAEIYFGYSRGERDVFLPKLPELLCFMIVNALQAASPKNQRIFNSFKFRELLLDWATELVGGLRIVSTRAGREWFFQDAVEVPLMTSNVVSAHQTAMAETLAQRVTTLPLNSVGCRYHLDHSPLVARYIEKNNPSLAAATAKNVLNVTMSHEPQRPLLSLQPGLVKTLKFREKKVDSDLVSGYRREATLKRSQILKEYALSKSQLNEDIGKLRTGMRAEIAMLKGGKGGGTSVISKKALIAQLAITTGTAGATGET